MAGNENRVPDLSTGANLILTREYHRREMSQHLMERVNVAITQAANQQRLPDIQPFERDFNRLAQLSLTHLTEDIRTLGQMAQMVRGRALRTVIRERRDGLRTFQDRLRQRQDLIWPNECYYQVDLVQFLEASGVPVPPEIALAQGEMRN